MSSLAWDCYCQCLHFQNQMILQENLDSWFLWKHGGGFHRTTGVQFRGISPEVTLSSPRSNSTHSSLPVSLQMHTPDAWQSSGRTYRPGDGGCQSGKETFITKEHHSKGSGGDVSHHHKGTLLDFFFPTMP